MTLNRVPCPSWVQTVAIANSEKPSVYRGELQQSHPEFLKASVFTFMEENSLWLKNNLQGLPLPSPLQTFTFWNYKDTDRSSGPGMLTLTVAVLVFGQGQ